MKLNNQSGGLARLRIARHPIARAVAGALMPAGLLLALAPNVLAGPQGGLVQAGQASIAQSGTLTTVQQASARAVINWRSFNVGAAESVRFDQPSSSAWVLNRVAGSEASSILGRITANGQVLLINPNGIVFGRSAQLDVAGLVASTANVSNADFMAGQLRFAEPGKPGAKVENQGRITVANGGLAALVGHQVANSGFINARLGKVVLAAGDAFTLDLYGDRLVNLIVGPEAMAQLVDSAGVPLAARVDQQGKIVADGGVVQISAATAQRLVDNAINVGGTIRATSFNAAPGVISLRGDSQTRLSLAGTLDASGVRGGRVEVTAGAVRLADSSRIDVSGLAGGGTVSVGGGWQGSGELPHARSVTVARGAVIEAGAGAAGQGGIVALWSDGDMRFEGRVGARGGASGGDGGQVEVSGRERLAFAGDVDAGARAGRAGSLLLDPANLVVAGGSGSESLPGAGAEGDFTVKAAAVNRQLVNGTSVTLQASNDITVNADAVIDGRVASGGTAGGGLTLQAGRDIGINGLVILNNGAFSASAGRNLTQAASSAIATGSGAVTATAGATLVLSNVLSTGAVSLRSTGGAVRVSEALGGAGGTRLASLQVQAQGDLRLQRGALVAGTTTMDSGATAVRSGAIVTPAAVNVSSNGAVNLDAVAAAAGTVNEGIAKAQGLVVRTAGNVTLGGAAAASVRLEGASAGQRAGAVDFGDASVFSSGDVQVIAGSITMAKAGIKSGGALSLAAAGSFVSGEGKLESAGAASVNAGSSATLGSGGLEVTGAHTATMNSAGTLMVNGAIKSGAAVVLASTGAGIALNRNVNASGFTANAAGNFEQDAASAVAAGNGAIGIASSGGNVSATNLVTTGAVTLAANQGALRVSAALSGDNGQRVAALQATALDGLTLNGALVAGTTMLSSGATLDTTAATLDSTGAVTLSGITAVRSGAVVTPAAVAVNSNGSVTLGAVAAAAGTLNEGIAKAQILVVRTASDVTLGGAAVGSLLMEGASSGQRAGAVDFGNASVFSSGNVTVNAGSIALADAGIKTGAALVLDAAAAFASGVGRLESAGAATIHAGTSATLGVGGLEVTTANRAALSAMGTLTVNGALKSGAAVELTSPGAGIALNRNVNARSFTANAAGNFTQDSASAVAVGSGAIDIVSSGGSLSASNLITTGAVTLSANQGALTVAAALSGENGQRVAALEATARDGLTLHGAVVAGTTTLRSGATLDTTAATLDSGGAVALTGATAVRSGAIVTPAVVNVTSTGAVSLGAVAGAAGTVEGGTAKAQSLTVHSAGNVTLAGAAVGSLLLEGVAAGQRTGGVDFGDTGVFSHGDVQVNAASITLAKAGIQSGGALTLNAAAAFASGHGKLESAGAARISAGSTASLGSGGLEVTTSNLATLSAGAALTLDGVVKSGAAVALVSTSAGIALNRNVNSRGFTAQAATKFSQHADSTVAAGTGAIDITSAGSLSAGTLVTTGAVTLQSTQGAVAVAGTLSGGTAERVASLRVNAHDDLTLRGALVAGNTVLVSAQGAVDTRAGTLDSIGDVTLSGATAVRGGAIVTPAAVSVSSGGAVSLGPVAGVPGTLDVSSPAARALTVHTPGGVTLGGAALGVGGLRVEGKEAGDAALQLAFADGAAGVYSAGAITIESAGDITLGGAGLSSAGELGLRSRGGSIDTGSGLVNAGGSAMLHASSRLLVGAGGVSAGSNVTLQADGQGVKALGRIGTLGGAINVVSLGSAADVVLNDISTAGRSASGSLTVRSQRDIELNTELGGRDSGYGEQLGYSAALRPLVGQVGLAAGRDVLLSGLNLDGTTLPHKAAVALKVVAGHRIVSNRPIATNKGSIQLSSNGTAPLSGVYLGDSVYSRGFDADGTSEHKVGYSITIDGGSGAVVLFDHTSEFAWVPMQLGSSSAKAIGKIIVGNNVVNYVGRNSGLAVEANAAISASLFVNVLGSLYAADNPNGQALTLANMPTQLLALDHARSVSSYQSLSLQPITSVADGIALKVQTFTGPAQWSQESSAPVPVDATYLSRFPCNPATFAGCSIPARLTTTGQWDGAQTTLAGSTSIRYVASTIINGGSGTTDPGLYAYQQREPGYLVYGNVTASNVRRNFYTLFVENLRIGDDSYNPTTGVTYALQGRVVQTRYVPTPQMLVYPGLLSTEWVASTFNATSPLGTSGGAQTNLGESGASNPGFQAVGNFGAVQPGSVGAAVGSNPGSVTLGSVPAGSIGAGAANGSIGAVSFGSLGGGTAGAGNGNGAGTGVVFGGLGTGATSSAITNGFVLPPAGVPGSSEGGGESNGSLVLRPVELSLSELQATLDELLAIGSRPAAQADLGRGGASSGSATNVFRKRYPIAHTLDDSVCGGADLQATSAGATPARACPATR